MSAFDSFFQAVQKATLPGVWSKGVALSRENAVLEDSRTPDGHEITLRVRIPNRPVTPKVNLWPEEEDWYCDCGDRNDPCLHIVAAVVALKNGTLTKTIESPTSAPSLIPELHYCLVRKNRTLSLERWIIRGGTRERLSQSLIRFIGGITSGRVAAPPIPATQDDYTVDQILQSIPGDAHLERSTWSRLLPALRNCPRIFLEGTPVRISTQKMGPRAQLLSQKGGIQLSLISSAHTEIFTNGVLLQKIEDSITLHECTSAWDPAEIQTEKFYPSHEIPRFTAEVLPYLRTKLEIDTSQVRLPELITVQPKILLKTDTLPGETLVVTASIVYGEPPLAELTPQLSYLSQHQVPVRNIDAERKLIQQLQTELHLRIGMPIKRTGREAIEFIQKTRSWNLVGKGAQQFQLSTPLRPRIESQGTGFQVHFETQESTTLRTADPSRVFQAWRENLDSVPLIEGGYAPLPSDWLNRYGERILALASQQQARENKSKLPQHFLPEFAELCEEMGCAYPESLKKLRQSLADHRQIPAAKLPSDLHAQLRHYQKQGIDWLCFLRDSGMGALLADDMGLGKTLQALAAIQGKTLIVAPTSVLQSWAEQISKFRPSLQYSIYHGAQRDEHTLNSGAQIILTSYGILRMDLEKLSAHDWDTLVLDEAQTIKNPQSQVAQAAHRLRGSFRIALSGTPIENRLEDLWSQFQFTHPGLLGDVDTFKNDYIEPISRGFREASQRLKRKIQPFLLRRLKKEVAPELPPRTEIVLRCELSSTERELYQAILASTRKEVLAQLQTGGSIFAALEALLRLRQACCHPLLVPGGSASSGKSSKLALLLESLEESVSLGHRSLIFSQWTTLLDLVEKELKPKFTYSRLDGTTHNRAEVIADFQRPDGPDVMLLSLKAGGVGITLTAADHVYILDPWWNPATEDQAADRAHRIGQENPVLIHRLVAQDTVEERILALQKKKQELSAAVLGDSSGIVSLTRDDLLQLLSFETGEPR